MDSEGSKLSNSQFTISSGLLLTAAIAAVLGLGKYWENSGGFVFALAAAALPFAFVVELIFRRPCHNRETLTVARIARRTIAILICTIFPALAINAGLIDQMHWWSPAPLLAFLPVAQFYDLVTKLPYAIWCIPVPFYLMLTLPMAFTSNHRNLPLRSIVLMIIATLTSIVWFAAAISTIGQYQSKSYFIGAATANSVIIAVLWTMWIALRKHFNFPLVLIWNLILICWLFWLAYPWLGEYI